MFFSKFSIAALTALVALGESQNNLGVFPKRPLGTGVDKPRPTNTIFSSITLAPVPLSTGATGPPSLYTTVTETGDVTLTYTLGSGTSTSVVTTTIHRTATETSFVTITPGGNAPGADDSTTTTTLFSTSTQTVTVLPAATSTSQSHPGSGSNPGSDSNPGSGSNSGSGGDSCSGQATVTVTEKEKETVTVTAFPDFTSLAPNYVVATSSLPGENGESTTITVTNQASQTGSPGPENGESTVTVSTKATQTAPYKLPPSPSNSDQSQPTTAPYPIPQPTHLTSSGFLTSKKPLPTGYKAPFHF
ncbi:uncharacterized protein TRUGW13939_03382 [Talaromyces rugulosus]|uniref:Uncharacterized protein n=1 Tax=Talaromyces rugulosus TaxID=121627 RepID=A0A7H8QS41_TALRU|nr:uncharacterized protein TRUGW13939_03382 [Talaromyces rugulosus]QKX56281.1 hypothetical protein TRUGW13939_03382 [Talaromyces rugulosus]